MPSQKYNWESIKQKYFESEILGVKDFLMSSLGLSNKTTTNGYYKGKTLGWRAEKEKILRFQTQKAVKDLVEDPKIKIANQNILIAINNYEGMVANLIGKGPLSLDQAIKSKPLWEVLRIRMNLPTAYNKNVIDGNVSSTVLIQEILKAQEDEEQIII